LLVDQNDIGISHDSFALVDNMATDGGAGCLRAAVERKATERDHNCD
jgi:hypothetical protein